MSFSRFDKKCLLDLISIEQNCPTGRLLICSINAALSLDPNCPKTSSINQCGIRGPHK
jgi:hypothetical protein